MLYKDYYASYRLALPIVLDGLQDDSLARWLREWRVLYDFEQEYEDATWRIIYGTRRVWFWQRSFIEKEKEKEESRMARLELMAQALRAGSTT